MDSPYGFTTNSYGNPYFFVLRQCNLYCGNPHGNPSAAQNPYGNPHKYWKSTWLIHIKIIFGNSHVFIILISIFNAIWITIVYYVHYPYIVYTTNPYGLPYRFDIHMDYHMDFLNMYYHIYYHMDYHMNFHLQSI